MSSNKEKYEKVFIDSFSLSATDLNDTLEYNSIGTWDSIGHMGMIDELENVFGITLEADDIIDFSSFKKGQHILGKYGITF